MIPGAPTAPRRAARRLRGRGLAALALLAAAGPASAALFSPGDLSRAHAQLSGLGHCTACHAAGRQLSPETCLACHRELAPRIAAGSGLHGRLAPATRATCEACHHEHQGPDFPLVDWGAPGEKGFDHARAGLALEGKHRTAACARCHDPRLVADGAVRAAIGRGRRSWLGAPTACAACHADEHRGQLGTDCQRCHGTAGWRPTRFDHARAAYRLDGRHLAVACARCHADRPAPPSGDPGARTALVRPGVVTAYKGLAFRSCSDCHRDPHGGRLGAACAGCHATAGWKDVRGGGRDVSFHARTRYPLLGLHARVRCEGCHGPFRGEREARYRGLAFDRCTRCHADSHLGQLATAAPGAGAGAGAGTRAGAPAEPAAAGPACERCHTVAGFTPARFELEDHARLAFRLEGAHRAISCVACHPRDPRLAPRAEAAARAARGRRGEAFQPSLARLRVPGAEDCRTCHRDPHAGQFGARQARDGCAGCHGVDAFRPARFNHRSARLALDGKHASAPCAACHRPGAGGGVAYRPLPLTCAGCHADPHAGQLARGARATDCGRCHETAGWKRPPRFDHRRDARFPLDGKHAAVACDRCHRPVAVAAGVEPIRYRPLPVTCEGCHADFHRGAFRGFAP